MIYKTLLSNFSYHPINKMFAHAGFTKYFNIAYKYNQH